MTRIMTTTLTPLAAGALLFAASYAQAQTSQDAQTGGQPGIATVVVSASADASAQGLPAAYAGGQVARGGVDWACMAGASTSLPSNWPISWW
jgi:iron complex outermembrane receptor protein